MKKATLAVLLVGVVGLVSLAADALVLKGDIIDNMCLAGNTDHLADVIKVHPKECALVTHCDASGYSILVGGTLYKFDQASNKKIEKFLKKSDSKPQVEVKAEKVGEELKLVSIENQK